MDSSEIASKLSDIDLNDSDNADWMSDDEEEMHSSIGKSHYMWKVIDVI